MNESAVSQKYMNYVINVNLVEMQIIYWVSEEGGFKQIWVEWPFNLYVCFCS